MRNDFPTLLKRLGRKVTVTNRTPQTISGVEVKDDRNQTVYDEEDITLDAVVNIIKGTEQKFYDIILNVGDGIGLFRFEDTDYVKKDNILSFTDNNTGYSFKFTMLEAIPVMTHIEVPMVREVY